MRMIIDFFRKPTNIHNTYAVSSRAGGLVWSARKYSWVLFNDRNTSVWAECFWTSYNNTTEKLRRPLVTCNL